MLWNLIDTYPKHQLWATLGINLVLSAPAEDKRLEILNRVWNHVSALDKPDEYVRVAEAWIEYPLHYLGTAEVDILLKDLLVSVCNSFRQPAY